MDVQLGRQNQDVSPPCVQSPSGAPTTKGSCLSTMFCPAASPSPPQAGMRQRSRCSSFTTCWIRPLIKEFPFPGTPPFQSALRPPPPLDAHARRPPSLASSLIGGCSSGVALKARQGGRQCPQVSARRPPRGGQLGLGSPLGRGAPPDPAGLRGAPGPSRSLPATVSGHGSDTPALAHQRHGTGSEWTPTGPRSGSWLCRKLRPRAGPL